MSTKRTIRSKDGTTLAYDVYGNGPALIYITGARCFRSFIPVVRDAKTFAESFTVFNYDRRGRGDSTNSHPYAVEREVEDIAALIDAAGGRASLYGHSSGAVLALEAALRLSDRVNGVVMYDPPYVCDEREKADYDSLSNKVNALLEAGKNARAMRTFLKGIGMPPGFVSLLRFIPGWRTMKRLAPTLAYDIALTRDFPPVERASRVTVPVQIVVGDRSPSGMHEVARRLADAIPNATLHRLADQDHLVSASVLLPLLERFLSPRRQTPALV
jgi:pimeloyl-ACP methyl ester carboxylesterase